MKMSKTDVYRTIAFSSVGLLALIPMWEASQVLFYFIGAISLIALFSHFARKLFFPYVDLQEFANKALENSVAAAIVFASVTFLICTLVYVAGGLIGFSK